jgi:hypothetical protein
LQYCSVKARDAMNRRLYNNQSIVLMAIYSVFISEPINFTTNLAFST